MALPVNANLLQLHSDQQPEEPVCIGTTSDLRESMHKHKVRPVQGVIHSYFLDHLVWFEKQEWFLEAIRREKGIKCMDRCALVEFIEAKNPLWEDLSPEFVRIELNEILKQIHLN